MNERTALDPTKLDPDLKSFFELQTLKQLFEDVFFAFVQGHPGNHTPVELAEVVFNIAHMQGYDKFDAQHRSQLVESLEQLVPTYRDICRRYSVLKNKFPDIKFQILGGWRHYRAYNDGLTGKVLKVQTEVRVNSGRTALEMFNENIIKATVWLIDRFNYNYRTDDLQEWSIQNNLVVWKDIIQGNSYLNFILTKERFGVYPMRVVVSSSTRPMIKPMPPPPTPVPWPGPMPGPVPPGELYPCPPPVISPVPAVPGGYPMAGAEPQHIMGPDPTPTPGVMNDPYTAGMGIVNGPFESPTGIQPSPMTMAYPPGQPQPAPVPLWPIPPPPPPVVADCALIRSVIAERTVGGIKKGSVLPAGLTYTTFVEWLLHADEEHQDVDPKVSLSLVIPSSQEEMSGDLVFTINDLGTAQPHKIQFFYTPDPDAVNTEPDAEEGEGEDESGDTPPETQGGYLPAPRDRMIPVNTKDAEGDTFQGELTYQEGVTEYTLSLQQLPAIPVKFYAVMTYTSEYDQIEGTAHTNYVPYVPVVVIYSGAVRWYPPEQVAGMSKRQRREIRPDADQIKLMTQTPISDKLLGGQGIRVPIPTKGNTIFVAFPKSFEDKVKWYNATGTIAEAHPEPYEVLIGGINYNAYLWDKLYLGPNEFRLRNS